MITSFFQQQNPVGSLIHILNKRSFWNDYFSTLIDLSTIQFCLLKKGGNNVYLVMMLIIKRMCLLMREIINDDVMTRVKPMQQLLKKVIITLSELQAI